MNWVALKMLLGDRVKYLGIVFGVAFAALLMAQQSAIFCGLMRNTTSQIRDIQGADVWVMDKNVQFVDDTKPLSENALYRVRGVEGVRWAVRLYKGLGRARLADGNFQQVILIGVDDATLTGAPAVEQGKLLVGKLEDLRQPDAVFMDEFGWRYLFGSEPFVPGKTLEMNDKRAVIVGLVKCSPTFQTFPILYCTYSQAVKYVPQERKTLTFVLAKADDGVSPEELCARIEGQTGDLRAQTNDQFFWSTIGYYLKRTGIPINFGITVALGFIVGCAIAGQTFYLFTVENLKQFGSLKAMGVSNMRIVRMVMLQALVVGLIGYGLGVGGAALFGFVFERAVKNAPPAFHFPWQVLVITAGAVLVIISASAAMSLKRVLFLEPAVVFR
ncbi:FtsX-like permease family protein [Gemmata obscuriglobus]|uniref:ABC transporter permease n=1 Tax=Gemmata obscuriglobus TaxID=114 RepID=A0A2Z3GUD2_9BACT|nr:ABC transporter permease [Gemmata obscuriglobus]AWM36878.1 ABC transporter permease [Gemmata obscuriglobus]QEG30449.1 FtsX-like permease family protein [Gemmata obscuriglobus]VTS09773.1 abc transporter permease : ABC transporter system permease protein OS=uncultured planctomycete GN=HGMM_F12C05C04 PE=4 SV=1: MacB_PCD: FtsX [Gemmata obscuriglobus UQM 2246]